MFVCTPKITSHELSAYALADIEHSGMTKTGTTQRPINFRARDFRCAHGPAPNVSVRPTRCGCEEFSTGLWVRLRRQST